MVIGLSKTLFGEEPASPEEFFIVSRAGNDPGQYPDRPALHTEDNILDPGAVAGNAPAKRLKAQPIDGP